MQFFMYFRQGIECPFPLFTYTYRFLIISVVYLSPVVVERIVGSRNLILLSRADAFHDSAWQMRHHEHTSFAKTVRVIEKWKRAFIPRQKYIINRIFAPQIFQKIFNCRVMILNYISFIYFFLYYLIGL